MCLIAFDHRPGEAMPLRLVANRDEFHARPSAALAPWDDAPGIVGGRDLEAGGTWLAVHRRGRFAAVTNVRDPGLGVPRGAPSRGALVRKALQCPDLPARPTARPGTTPASTCSPGMAVGSGTCTAGETASC